MNLSLHGLAIPAGQYSLTKSLLLLVSSTSPMPAMPISSEYMVDRVDCCWCLVCRYILTLDSSLAKNIDQRQRIKKYYDYLRSVSCHVRQYLPAGCDSDQTKTHDLPGGYCVDL